MSRKLTWRAWRSAALLCTERNPTCRPSYCSYTLRPATGARVEAEPRPQLARWFTSSPGASYLPSSKTTHFSSKEVEARTEELQASGKDVYPRYASGPLARCVRSLIAEVDSVPTASPSVSKTEEDVEVLGRITSIRMSGSKLAFIDIVEDQLKLQIVLSHAAIEAAGVSKDEFKRQCGLIRRGDFVAVKGLPPYRASNGQVSIKATTLPTIQSPCLNRFPVEQRGFSTSEASEAHYHDRHVEMLTDPSVIETMKTRASIVRTLRSFFESKSFIEVQTPLLAGQTGGAMARPFETAASEFTDRNLTLRIAPELWLKRLIVGGMDRIFEIGPCFRNEGLDKTHNPEFSTCEFYAVRHDLPSLMAYTEDLLGQMARSIQALDYPIPPGTSTLLQSVQGEYQTLDFLPALNAALGEPLPDLASSTAHQDLLRLFESKSLPLPSSPTLPRLLDKLSSIYLEPQSLAQPTWIANIPACLSPLAKSFAHASVPGNPQVAARAELFIQGKEVVNCYEEENSPFAQRQKFIDQQLYARQQAPSLSADSSPDTPVIDDEVMPLDEAYIQALEWGLPPTGGWGCGIDRLVMLFTGRERISDVLSFGSLRHVTRGAEKKGKASTEVK